MQTRTNLGMSLGEALATAFGGTDAYKQKGVMDGQRSNALEASARKDNAEADLKNQQREYGTDDNLIKGLLAGIGANSDNGLRDFNASMSGTYKPPTKPLAFEDGGTALPPPEYVAQFPELQKKYAGLKQMLALGDKNLEHLSGSIQGDQRNAITAKLTPENANTIALATNAIDGKDPTKIAEANLINKLANGEDNPQLDLANALLLAQGKTRYDNTGNVGTMDLLTGLQKLNSIGTSETTKNNAQANQANAGATENLAQAGLANTRKDSIKSGNGDGTNSRKDFAQIRDDIRADYNAEFPFNAIDGNRGKNAPDFNTYTKKWLKQYNIDESAFFRGKGGETPPPAGNKITPQYQEYLDGYEKYKGDPAKLKRWTEFNRSKGIVK